MKKVWTKVGMIAGFVLLVVMLGFIVKMQWDANKQRDAINKGMIEMKQLADGIVRNQSKYVSKDDLEKFAEDMDLDLAAIQKDLDEFGAEIEGISSVMARSVGYSGSNLSSTGTTPKDPEDPENPEAPTCPDGTTCPDLYGYLGNEQLFLFHETFTDGSNIPLGTVGFSAWKSKPWSVDIKPREYHMATVIGRDEDGRVYVHNKMRIGVDGKMHTVPIDQAEFQEVYPESAFRFDPHLTLGVDVGASIATSTDANKSAVQADVVPNLQVTLFSYGETKVNPDWTFLGLGLGYEAQRNSLGILLSPVNYNVGKPLPLMDNMYLGPVVGVDLEGNVFLGGGIRVGL